MKNARKSSLEEGASVLFATFSLWSHGQRMPTNGSVEPFRDFLVPRIRKLVLIDQPVPGSDDVAIKYEYYLDHNITPVKLNTPFFERILSPLLYRVNRTNTTQILFKVRDYVSVLWCGLRELQPFDYFVGLESINALSGVLLKKLGRVKKVVYYVSDYSPERYKNGLFNALYLWLDRLAAMHSDCIWDVSLAMQPARIRSGLDPSRSAPVVHVGNGVFPDQIISVPRDPLRPHALVFMGTVWPDNGPDIAIKAVAVLRKKYPDVSLDIIGGKPKDSSWLQPIISELGLQKAVKLHGFVPRASDMARIMGTCSIGLAPYRSFVGSPRWYGDAGKIRAYCAAGLPIVSSHVPPLGKELASYGAAVIARDDVKSFAAAIEKLFKNKIRYHEMRRKAVKYARENTWDHQFSTAFASMKKYESKTI